VPWDLLGTVRPGEITVTNAVDRLADGASWAELLPEPQELSADLVAEGHTIPVARVQAMHEGKRRAKARREEDS
jgi:hypothetical protein